MAIRSKLTGGPILRLDTSAIAAAPADAGVTPPHRFMSPRAAGGGQPSTGTHIGLKAPSSGAAVSAGGGFLVVLWYMNKVTRAWFACKAAAVVYDAGFVMYDLNAAALYYQVTAASVATPGLIDFHVWEL